jgi:hypothetical protein
MMLLIKTSILCKRIPCVRKKLQWYFTHGFSGTSIETYKLPAGRHVTTANSIYADNTGDPGVWNRMCLQPRVPNILEESYSSSFWMEMIKMSNEGKRS